MRVQPPRAFSFAKAGNQPSENEDAYRVSVPEPRGASAWTARLAIADGATEAAFSREWARLLVDSFVDGAPLNVDRLSAETLARWLEPCREQWNRDVLRRDIPWHGRAKVKQGAMATFCGINIRPAEDGGALAWQALAVGDCCLFIVREGRLHTAFPVDDPAQFGNTPSLLCSNPANSAETGQMQLQTGECRRDDLVVLATDAVACWALTQEWRHDDPWSTLRELCQKPPQRREGWVAARRADGAMRNDDATLLMAPIA